MSREELLALFGKNTTDANWIASADSQEYLAVVLYLIQTRYNPKAA